MEFFEKNNMAKQPLISIIIVNWNGYTLLKPCIESILKGTYKNIEIIVVDNASTDKSRQYVAGLSRKNKAIRMIQNETNTGFAEANNRGSDAAHGSYVLFLNNDTIVEKDFIEPLVLRLQSKKIGGVQPTILQHPKKTYVDSVGSYFLNTGFLYHAFHNKPLPKNRALRLPARRIFSMKGACMLIKKSVLDEVGVFDPTYFAYFEETDLCHRIWIAGYEVWYEPNSVIYHKGGITSSKIPTGAITYHSYKNRLQTYLKNFETKTLWKVMPQHLILCLLVAAGYALRGQIQLSHAVMCALWFTISHIRDIVVARNMTQHTIRRVPDSSYPPLVTSHVRISYYYHLFTTALAGYKD